MNRLKPGTATGPDGVAKKDLIAFDKSGVRLATLYCLFLRYARLPSSLKECRSILIPKGKEGLEDITNWRPSTIGSLVSRLYSSILELRLRSVVPLSARQRGFISSPGCEENLMLLESAIKKAKIRNGETVFVSLDLAKAFDTVSHDHIQKRLRDFGVCEPFRNVIADMYEDSSTRFECASGTTGPIPIRRGVKQGDPLSTSLFNIAIDPLLRALEVLDAGIEVAEGKSLSAQGFADDILSIGGSPYKTRQMLDVARRYSDETGMSFNAKKCATFTIRKSNKSWLLVPGEYHLVRLGQRESAETRIPYMGPGDMVKYLGMKVGPWRGVCSPKDPRAWLEAMVMRINHSPLKPSQKLFILTRYGIPRMLYGFCNAASPSLNLMRQLDRSLRRTAKQWFKLPACACDGMLYAKSKHGELALPSFARAVPRILLRKANRLILSPNDLLREVASQRGNLPLLRAKMEKVVKDQGGFHYRETEYLRWTQLGPQGFGVKTYQEYEASHEWLNRMGGGEDSLRETSYSLSR